MNSEPRPRCINLDWLEIFAFEVGDPHDEYYFMRAGFIVHPRDYGTRVYHQMFTLDGSDGQPFIEIRRQPKNPLMPQNACHIRFVNRSCYLDSAADVMSTFLQRYDYQFQRISRIDICLDFVRFDDNTIPRVFMQRYMRGKFSKINQANIHSHGTDAWTGRVWNSVSWGSPSSMVSTKFYNKTLELYDPKTDSYGKPYIRQQWLQCGLIDNIDRCTLNNITQEIWRVEFSIRSSVQRWFVIELNGKHKNYQSVQNTLEQYNSRDKLLVMFAALSNHYFHFKRYIIDQRKDRCPDRQLFRFQGTQYTIKPELSPTLAQHTPEPQLLILIRYLRAYINATFDPKPREHAVRLLQLLEQKQRMQELPDHATPEERIAWQQLLARRQQGDHAETLQHVMDEVRQLLRINDKTALF